jgi:hypothetical protein
MLPQNFLRFPSMIPFQLSALIVLFLILSCRDEQVEKTGRKVYVHNENGNYTLCRDGKPFEIKGAAGQSNLKKLQEIGGNSIRTYDTLNLGSVLDDAQKYNIAVMVGLPLPESEYSDYVYNKPEVVSKQFREIKNLVNRYKSHPALLMWCVGNELDFSPNLKYYNFYKAFNNIVKMIHQDDPDHLVTTTMKNLYPKNLFCISMFTDVDVLSTNIFISLDEMSAELDKVSWFWKGPFIISEWGIEGPWLKKRNAWGARIEETSNKKAERYREMYQYIPLENSRLLGSYVFYWGQKQETTHTWFSLFDEKGNQSEAVGIIEQLWTGKNTQEKSPDLNYMLVNSKGAADNIILKPGEFAQASLNIPQPDSTNYTVWEIYPEDWFFKDNVKNDQKLKPVEGSIVSSDYLNASFKAPVKEGPYRIFATVYNKSGNFATCNTPFYVVSSR